MGLGLGSIGVAFKGDHACGMLLGNFCVPSYQVLRILNASADKVDKNSWVGTPFSNCMLNRNIKSQIIKLNVTHDKCVNNLLDNGSYYMLIVGSQKIKDFENQFGAKAIKTSAISIEENELFSGVGRPELCIVRDVERGNYQISPREMLSYLDTDLAVCHKRKGYLVDMQKALKAGNLAIVEQDVNIFGNFTGTALIDLKRCYGNAFRL